MTAAIIDSILVPGLTAILVLILASGFAVPPAAAAGKTINVGEGLSERTVRLASGDTLVVSLLSTPGTGFSWRVAQADPSMLQQVGKPELIHSPNPQPGAAATQVFRFAVRGGGTTDLRLEYLRPWEHVPPARTFHLVVIVH